MADEVQFLCYANRQSGSAGCHPHHSCCSGAHPLHLLGCEKGLRLHLHVPLPVHLPQRAAGVPRHPGLPAPWQRRLPLSHQIHLSSWLLFGIQCNVVIHWTLQIFFPLGRVAMTIYGFLATLVFSGFIIFDTHMLLKRHTYNEYVVAAIALYLDVINLFMAQMSLSFQWSIAGFTSTPPPWHHLARPVHGASRHIASQL